MKNLTILLLFLIPTITYSSIDFEDAAFPEIITSARALAMGNAYINKADDSAAAFYNPAGLGSVRYGHFHISNLHLETNSGWFDMSAGGNALSAPSSISKGLSLDGVRELLNENKGTVANSRFHIAPNLTMRYFSAGFFISKRTKATVGTQTDAKFEYASRMDYGPYLSLDLAMLGGIFKLGFTGMLLSRTEALGEADPTVTFALTDNDYYKGTFFNMIAGAKLSLPLWGIPSFGVTIHNLSGGDFSARAKGAPQSIKRSMDFAFSWTPHIGKTTRVHLETNFKDFSNAYGADTKRRILLGLELDFFRTLFFRTGYGDGFGSFGIGIRTRRLEFDFTTYAVDTTAAEFRGIKDRRYAISMSTGF